MPDPDDLNPLLNAMSGQTKKLDDLMDILLAQAKIKSSGKKGDTSDFDFFYRSMKDFTSVVDILDQKFTNFTTTTQETNAKFNILTDAAKTGAVTTTQLFSELGKSRDDVDKFNKEVEGMKKTAERLAKSSDAAEQQEASDLNRKLKSSEMLEKIAEADAVKVALGKAYSRALRDATGNIIREYLSYEGIVKDAGKGLKAAGELAAGGLRNIGAFMSSGDMFGPVKAGFDTFVDVTNKGAQAVSKGGQSAGDAMSKSANPLVAVLGGVISGVSAAAGGLSEVSAKLAKEGFSIMVEQTKKLITSYDGLVATGAVFGNGLTGMVKAAGSAGLTVEHFSNVVKKQSSNLALSGLGVTAGAKAMGEVTASFKASGVRDQLRVLGYSFEEQAELTAEVMASMRKSGASGGSTQQVADETKKYAENLRLISAITGEDAKKKVAQAAEQNNFLAFQQKMSGKSVEQRAQIDAAMSTMTEQEKKNFRERVVLGNVINKEGAIYEASIDGAREKGEAALALFDSNNLTAKTNGDLNAQYGAQIKASALSQTELAVAASVAGGALTGVATAGMDAITQAQRNTPEALAAAKKDIEEAKEVKDKATKDLMGAAGAAYDLQLKLQDLVLKALPGFADITNKILTGYNDVFDAIREALGLKAPKEKNKTEIDAAEAKKLRNEKTAAIKEGGPGAAEKVRAISQQEQKNLSVQTTRLSQRDAKDVLAGPRDATFAKILEEYNLTEAQVADIAAGKAKKLATGGITNGLSFAGESGPEAVIPLPDGKTIPVTIKLPTQEAMPADTTGSTGVMASLTSMIDKFSTFPTESKVKSQLTAMEATSTQFNSAVLSALKAQTELLTMAMTKYDNIANTLRDGNDLHKKILNAST